MRGGSKVRKSKRDWVKYFVLSFGAVVYFIILAAILNNGLNYNFLALPIIFAAVVFLVIKNKEKIISLIKNNSRIVTILLLVLIVIGFIARFSFVLLQDRFYISESLSDTGVHWHGSQQLVSDGQFDAEIGEYERIFPYLSAYTGVLSISKAIFGDNYFAVLFINIVFDVISCIVIYLLFYFWKRSRSVALFASTVWALSPLQIVFCGLPLAIVVVNTFVILSILLVFLLFRCRGSMGKMCIISAACGVAFAVGNAFRPIFVIFLLATIAYWVFVVLAEKGKGVIKKPLISCLIMAVTYLVVGLLPGAIHTGFNPYYHGEKARSGWGVYVGSNYGTNGRWSRDDSNEFFGPVLAEQAGGDVEQAQSIIMHEAVDRYFAIISDGNLIQHFLNKISVVFGDVKNSIYDLPHVFNFSRDNRVYKVIQDEILVFYHLLLFIIGYNIVAMTRKKDMVRGGIFVNYLIILFVGLFLAFLLVEAMNRYCLPFVAILLIIALGLSFKEKQASV